MEISLTSLEEHDFDINEIFHNPSRTNCII